MENENKFTKENTLGDVVKLGDNYINVLMGFGMHCFSCPCAQMETLEEAADVHGVDVDLLLEKLNNVQ